MCQLCDASVRMLELVKSGTIWRDEDGAYVGRAADGVVVQLGCNAVNTRDYLSDHPNPEDW